MTRPAFLSRPGVWTRTARTAQSQADYACAVEHNVKRTAWHPAEWVTLILFACFLAALIFWS
ncbi:MAG: hypothetical protein IPH41_13450 [Sulfuritalea sp.]|nr:hypothetical protein [Sulfuritalea sp.]